MVWELIKHMTSFLEQNIKLRRKIKCVLKNVSATTGESLNKQRKLMFVGLGEMGLLK